MKTQYCVVTTILKDDGMTVIEEFGSGEFLKLEDAILETINNLTWALIERELFKNKNKEKVALDVIKGVINKINKRIEIVVDTPVNN